MTKLINMKGAVALAMALSFCVYSVAPTLDNSTIVSKPITSYEAQAIKGGILLTATFLAACILADVAIISAMVTVYGMSVAASQKQGSSSSND